MDLSKQLVRSCARAFYSQPPYDVRHVLVVDALAIHGALVCPQCVRGICGMLTCCTRLRDDDLGYLLNISAMKDLHKLCAKLKDDRFLHSYV